MICFTLKIFFVKVLITDKIKKYNKHQVTGKNPSNSISGKAGERREGGV